MTDYRIISVTTPAHVEAARAMFREYAASLDFSLEYQGLEAELAGLPGRYGPPGGCILLAMEGEDAVGCVALREIGDAPAGRVCEMKRLYVRPGVRGRRIGRAMCEELISRARAMGYARMKLDTSADMQSAQALYSGLGFVPCERYNDDPMPCTLYFELVLRPAG